MVTGTSDAPVRRASFTSTDVEEVTDYIERMYVGNRMRFGAVHGPAGFTAEYAEAGPIATDRVRCSIDYRGSTEPWTFFCSFVLDQGTAKLAYDSRELRLRPGEESHRPRYVGPSPSSRTMPGSR